MSADPYLGEIILVPYTFVPQGWAACNGQLLSIAQYQALFSLLGTTYGGDGRTTFALPNLGGRFAMGHNNTNQLGQSAGHSSTTLTVANLPAHNHIVPAETVSTAISLTLQASNGGGNTSDPTNAVWANANDPTTGGIFDTFTQNPSQLMNMKPVSSPANIPLPQQNTSIAGGSIPVDITNPYLVLYYIISLQGIYPSRS
ncbi:MULTISPECIES: phage tail protein [Acinetobacter]|jgi:microcystin-dependent protein|uniref:Phage Tail Collar Domain protein n=1 Tax=Acinetobacter venetianus TaxID=52133 RepID=A0A150HMM2_9GAMM|nr:MULTISPECIES: tail fiber protein [Acinetobacter]MDA0695144.1 tail fiber protein [Pseudomonadota bacterium]KXZ67359.1 Phage Tail Collar Domain protein [Acinetobacter venetianus]MBC70190.1 microcystin-dependent protein [Acinetobacter sp.]MBT48960.1 microcystin-dependent protein [Acinetobacter sp.]MCR4530404.1 tail fiber protein [Acinetobacter venetianus]